MVKNTDPRAAYRDRLIHLEEEIRTNREDKRGIAEEMKSEGLSKVDIAGIKLAVKRHFEEPDKRLFRESAEQIADALGEYSDLPLGRAAVERAA